MKLLMLSLACIAYAACLGGCDLGGTAAATAAGSSAEIEQARQAKQIEDRVRQRADDAVHQDTARREQAEKDAQ